MKTPIKNGRVVTTVDDYRADILIEDGTVSMSGKLVIPGGIDPRDKYGTAVWRDAIGGRFFYRDAGGGDGLMIDINSTSAQVEQILDVQ